MKNIILIGLSLLSFSAFSQGQTGQLTITKGEVLAAPTAEVVEAEVLPVIIEVKETEERIITKKTYAKIIIITSEIKEEE